MYGEHRHGGTLTERELAKSCVYSNEGRACNCHGVHDSERDNQLHMIDSTPGIKQGRTSLSKLTHKIFYLL